MCQNNYTIKKEKYKRLTESDLGRLEECLNNNEKTGLIAYKLGTDPSTIKKIIFKHKYKVYGKYKERDCYKCAKYNECEIKGLCDCSKDKYSDCSKCKGCNIAEENCKDFEPIIKCKKIKGHRTVCNGCSEIDVCNRPKIIFTAKKAIKDRTKNKENSRKKTKISKSSLNSIKIFDEYFSPKIEKQISVEVVLNTMPIEIKEVLNISVPTLYKYIDECFLSCRNIDLRNKLKRKENKTKKIKPNRSKNRANGRSVHNISEEDKKQKNICEIDTVEGIKGGKMLFTLITSNEHFMFGLPISSKTQENIISNLDKLEKVLGYENY